MNAAQCRRPLAARACAGVERRRALPRRHPADLPGSARRHVLHRPGDPDRPVLAIVGDRAPEHVDRPRARGARPQQAAVGAVLHLREQGPARRFRHVGADVEPGDAGHPAHVSGDASSSPRSASSSAPESACRWASGRRCGAAASSTRSSASWALIGYSIPIFWLGLMALVRVLRAAGLGRRARPHRCRLRVHADAGDGAPAARLRARRANGRPSATRCRTSSCRLRCSATFRSPTSAA